MKKMKQGKHMALSLIWYSSTSLIAIMSQFFRKILKRNYHRIQKSSGLSYLIGILEELLEFLSLYIVPDQVTITYDFQINVIARNLQIKVSFQNCQKEKFPELTSFQTIVLNSCWYNSKQKYSRLRCLLLRSFKQYLGRL